MAEADAGSTLPPGTRVWGFTDWSMRRVRSARSGAYAECVCAPEAQVAPLPSSLGFGQAAALAPVSLTAWQVWWPAGWGFRMLLISISCLAASGQRWHKWAPAAVGEAVPQTCNQPIHIQPAVSLVNLSSCLQALDAAGLQRGQRVLIHAGAGGVGSVAIQLAKARGLHVTTTCSTRNLDFVREVGGVHGGQGWAAACCHHPSRLLQRAAACLAACPQQQRGTGLDSRLQVVAMQNCHPPALGDSMDCVPLDNLPSGMACRSVGQMRRWITQGSGLTRCTETGLSMQ